MAGTTIKVDSSVRDRLAVLAAQRGMTIRDLAATVGSVIATGVDWRAAHAINVGRPEDRQHSLPF
jgi:transposase